MMPDGALSLIGGGLLVAAALWIALAIVLRPKFVPRSVLNKSEQRLMEHLIHLIHSQTPGFLVCPQVAYGEFLSSKSRNAFWSVNAKRADFLIVDVTYHPVLVVEYQGSGHFGDSDTDRNRALASDKAKRVALKSAGVPLLEVHHGYHFKDVASSVLRHLNAHRMLVE